MRLITRPSAAITLTALLLVSIGIAIAAQEAPTPSRGSAQDGPYRFRSGIDLVNVTATVSDRAGRFVSDLHREDFVVYDDDKPVEVTQFSAERVPVSLGIALDTSGSMAGTKIREAQAALDRFVYDLLDKEDELFVYVFSNFPLLVQGWTTDRSLITRALGDIRPNGGTAMYDAVARALPLAARGRNQKKALVVISDGNDTASRIDIRDLKRQIRESEVLIYAIGIDGEGAPSYRRSPPPPRVPIPFPPLFPPRGRGGFPLRDLDELGPQGGSGSWSRLSGEHVNAGALREMTDDSGGRTEVIRESRDLDPATAGIADELSKQYYLGYPAPPQKDGRWHAIRVEVHNPAYRVRARTGYLAS